MEKGKGREGGNTCFKLRDLRRGKGYSHARLIIFHPIHISRKKIIKIYLYIYSIASFSRAFRKIVSSSNIPAASEEKAESLEGAGEGKSEKGVLSPGDSSRFKELYGGNSRGSFLRDGE